MTKSHPPALTPTLSREERVKVAFAGTPDFAARVLSALIEDSSFEIPLVISQPGRPKGRGLKAKPSPVESLAVAHGIETATPERWNESLSDKIREFDVDYLVTAAFGMLLPESALNAPRRAPLNVHASLLPRWRGAAPIQRAIEAGDAETGVSIFILEKTLDTGPVIAEKALVIGGNETSGELHDRLAALSAKLLPEALKRHFVGTLEPRPQDHSLATYAKKLRKEEGLLDWALPAETIFQKWRAFTPWPGVSVGGLKLKRISPSAGSGAPGKILSLDPLVVAAGEGALELCEVQESGRRAITGADFARGRRLRDGDLLP